MKKYTLGKKVKSLNNNNKIRRVGINRLVERKENKHIYKVLYTHF
jgi:hypothetical protein